MLDYVKRNSDVECVYQSVDVSLKCTSTTRGILRKDDNRKKYLELKSKCRVIVVSSPVVDESIFLKEFILLSLDSMKVQCIIVE